MLLLLISLLTLRCSSLHSHAEEDSSVMRREAKEIFTSTVKAVDPSSPESQKSYRSSAVIHVPGTSTSSSSTTTTTLTRGTVSPFPVVRTAQTWQASTTALTPAAPSPVTATVQKVELPFEVAPGTQASASGSAQTRWQSLESHYHRIYSTTTRRTMTVHATVSPTGAPSVTTSTTEVKLSEIPLKIPPHMEPVAAPLRPMSPEDLEAQSFQRAEVSPATTTGTVPTTMPVTATGPAIKVPAEMRPVFAPGRGERVHEVVDPSTTTQTQEPVEEVTTSLAPPEELAATTAPGTTDLGQEGKPFDRSIAKIKVKAKDTDLAGWHGRVEVVTRADGSTKEELQQDAERGPDDEAAEEVSTSFPSDDREEEIKKMNQEIDGVVLKDLPKVVATVAARLTGEPLESETPKAASEMVVKLLIQTPLKEVSEAILEMLSEMVKDQVANPVAAVSDALREVLDDYHAPPQQEVSEIVEETKEALNTPRPEAESQSDRAAQVINDVAEQLREGSTTEPEDLETTSEADKQSVDEISQEAREQEEDANASEVNSSDWAVQSSEVMKDEEPHTPAETMQKAKEVLPSASSNRPIAVHTANSHAPVKAGADSEKGTESSGEEDGEEEEVESPAKSGGKVLVGLTIFLGTLLMVVAMVSAGYMAYQRQQEQRTPLRDAQAAPAPAASTAASSAAPAAAAAPAPTDTEAAPPTFSGEASS